MNDTSGQEGKSTKAKKAHGPLHDVIEFATSAIDEADEKAAEARVQALRETHPDASVEDLVELLIKRKCMQTGAIGAITSGAAIVPGLGTVVAMIFGVAVDIGWTFKLQAELVLEIAAVYRRKLETAEKRNAVMLVTGISAGASQALRKAGTRIAEEATERLAQKSLTKAIPVLGTAASAGTNILFTYVIGQRAQAYFCLGPEAVDDWGESIRAITGVDERKVTNWLAETTERSWTLVSSGARDITDSVIVAGKSAGEVVVVSASKAGEAVTGVGRGVAGGIERAVDTVADWGKQAGEDIASGIRKAGDTVADAGRAVAEGATVAADAVAETGRKARTRIAAGRAKGAGAAIDVGDGIGEEVVTEGKQGTSTVKAHKRGKKRKKGNQSHDMEIEC